MNLNCRLNRFRFCWLLLAAWAIGSCEYALSQVDPTITPDSNEWPTINWTREDANSTYAEWDVFTDAEGGDNFPDVGDFGASSASVSEISDPSVAFITGGNIYSFAAATQFAVSMPGAGQGTGYDSKVVMQLVTRGSEVDPQTLLLSYGGGQQLLAPDSSEELDRYALGGFGGDEVTTIFSWDIEGVNPTAFDLQFNAAESSMSLHRLILDTKSFESQSGTPSGDYDGSGTVAQGDLDLVLLNWGSEVFTGNASAIPGGGLFDGLISQNELDGILLNWGNTQNLGLNSSVEVPEPGSLSIAFVLLTSLAVIRRCKLGK